MNLIDCIFEKSNNIFSPVIVLNVERYRFKTVVAVAMLHMKCICVTPIQLSMLYSLNDNTVITGLNILLLFSKIHCAYRWLPESESWVMLYRKYKKHCFRYDVVPSSTWLWKIMFRENLRSLIGIRDRLTRLPVRSLTFGQVMHSWRFNINDWSNKY